MVLPAGSWQAWGQCVSLPSLTPAGGHLPPHRWFRDLDDVHKHQNDRGSVSFRNSDHPSFDVCGHVNKPRSPTDICTATHGYIPHKHTQTQTPTDDRHPIDHGWFLGRMSCATPLACLITLCKYRVCRAIVHMFAGIRLFLCSICPLESPYHHSWT